MEHDFSGRSKISCDSIVEGIENEEGGIENEEGGNEDEESGVAKDFITHNLPDSMRELHPKLSLLEGADGIPGSMSTEDPTNPLLADFKSIVTSSKLSRSMTTPHGSLMNFRASLGKTAFVPQVVLDGSKLIIKLGKNDKFQFDSPCRILLSTPKVKLEHCNVCTTQAICQDIENTIVLDSGGIGQRFVPIPLSAYGTVYSKEGTAHVLFGGDVRRSKVHSRHLPYKTCNKFQAQYVEDEEEDPKNFSRQLSLHSTDLPLKKATKMVTRLAADPHGGVVYIRGDESVVRYKLKHDERVEVQSGSIIAWTLGIRFEYRSFCCFRFIHAVLGDGTIWVCNPRRTK